MNVDCKYMATPTLIHLLYILPMLMLLLLRENWQYQATAMPYIALLPYCNNWIRALCL